MALELVRQFSVNAPIPQRNHNFIDQEAMEFFDLCFPSDLAFYERDGVPRYGKVLIGYHRKERNPETDSNGLYILSRPDMPELKDFVSQMHFSQKVDYYVMGNAVRGVDRLNSEIFSFHNFVIDIDCHDMSEENDLPLPWLVDDVIWHLERDLWSTGKSPRPNVRNNSGRGAQLWLTINPLPAKQAWKYKAILTRLLDQIEDSLKEYKTTMKGVTVDRGASMKLCGWFRMPCTWNTKNGVKGSFEILNPVRYDHDQLYRKYVPKGYLKKRAKEGRHGTVVELSYAPLTAADREMILGGTSAMALRVTKLVQLREYRRKKGIKEKCRDNFCFAVFNALLADHDKEKAFSFVMDFNSRFKNPLPPEELTRTMATAAKIGGYKLTNEWLIKELGITKEEQIRFGIYPSGTVKRDRRGSNYTRDYIRKVRREDRDHRIWDLWQNGYNKSEIARTEKVSRNTVAKVIAAQEAVLEAQTLAEVEEELAAYEEAQQAEMQAAAGAETVTAKKSTRGAKCSKKVHLIYSAPLKSPRGMSTTEGQSIPEPSDIPPKGGDPPSSG